MKNTGFTYATVLVILVFYALSYAPVIRLQYGTDTKPARRIGGTGTPVSFYAPVHWAIDYTPARVPLLAWARLWDVAGFQSIASEFRTVEIPD